MSKSRESAEEIEFLRDVIARQRAEIERLHQELALRKRDTEGLRADVRELQKVPQSYRDEIVEHLREIERLKAEIKKRKYRTVDWLFD